MRNTYKKPKPFYMVYAEGGNAPAYKHEILESAEKEADRLSNKLGVNCYVLQAFEEYEPMKPIEVKKHKPKRPCWFQWKQYQSVAKTNALLDKLREEGDVPDLPGVEPDSYSDGDIVYCYNNGIHKISPVVHIGIMIQLFGTELRIKEEQL